MSTQKKLKLRLTVDLDEDVAERLVAQAQEIGITLDEHLAHVLEVHSRGQLAEVLGSLERLERLVGRNLYWSTLPYGLGVPRQQLGEEGLEHFWERSGEFASKITNPNTVPELD